MDDKKNLEHWERWAADYGSDLRATTKCVSLKRLEIEALIRRISACGEPAPLVLELGCGNGSNGFALATRLPDLCYLGLDFAPAMIGNAVKAIEQRPDRAVIDRMAFGVGDARKLVAPVGPDPQQPRHLGAQLAGRLPAPAVDLAFTDRMLINLASAEEQLEVMRGISRLLRPGGLFLMIENSVQTHRTLNEARAALGLPFRPPAEFNVFLDEDRVIRPFEQVLELVTVEDFMSIHDLVLYAVAPALAGGQVEYDTPFMTRLTDALVALGERAAHAGPFGQNRLWVWRKSR